MLERERRLTLVLEAVALAMAGMAGTMVDVRFPGVLPRPHAGRAAQVRRPAPRVAEEERGRHSA